MEEQYKKNQINNGRDDDNDDERGDVEPEHHSKKTQKKLPAKSKKKAKKPARVIIPAKVDVGKQDSKPCESPAKTFDESLDDCSTYQAGNFGKIQNKFIADFMEAAKKEGKCVSMAEARAEWSGSLKRAKLLANLSLPELKRRRFVTKDCESNPFKTRVQELAG